ncbi:PAN2-PAN3 deadenylation complex subunit PAN3 isoform X2 [Epargyreus clarus]|uniref:PAN2-PAN3 deadenylation complex subunit PAN3 isoform X2 n=1 Tax=Epargyreus clarus TaxID=520877 RepID=UPI003C2C35ED
MALSGNWPGGAPDEMDPSIYLPYSPPDGLPQESKLATYMNRNTSTPTRALNQAMGKLSIESSPTTAKKPMIGEFVPMNYYNPAPAILPETQENAQPNNMVALQSNNMVALQPNNMVALQPNNMVALQPNSMVALQPNPPQVHQENVGGTTYFYPTNSDSLNNSGGLNSSASIVGPEQCLGAGLPPGPPPPNPYASQMYSGTPTHMGVGQSKSKLPDNVEMYTELVPLENCSPHALSSSYRATHRQTGEHYALRRLHAYSSVITKRVEMWKQIDHPNVVRLYEFFTTQAFGDHSLILVYEYHAGSTSLLEKYLTATGNGNPAESNGVYHDPFSSDPDAPRPYTHQKNAMLRAVASGALLPEAVLWSLLVQLTAALRAVHTAGLACRSLDLSKVIMNTCRARITWCAAADSLLANASDVNQAQQDDLTGLGRLALSLACRSRHLDNLSASLDLVTRSYSSDLKNLIVYLLSSTQPHRNVTDLMPMIGARFYTQVEDLERRADALEDHLNREFDNGRLFRILVKMGMINERPELNLDGTWSETGDRYMLKLFRDYIFHSVTEDGRPWIDLAHVVYCLNQLDSGTNNKSVLVVSYSELKQFLEQAFDEVMQAANAPP